MDKIKARSRLRRQPLPSANKVVRQLPGLGVGDFWRQRLRFWPLLLLGAAAYTLILLLFRHVPPSSVQNWLWPSSYLPLQILLLLGNFFIFTFLTLHKKFGFSLSVFCASLLFLHLQAVQLEWLALALAASISSTLFWLLLKI